jgi:hypothetical protein
MNESCADCGTRGNICCDSDGVERCTLCSYARWQVQMSAGQKAMADAHIAYAKRHAPHLLTPWLD